MKDQTIGSKLLFAQNAVANALNVPEASEALALFGYDKKRLKEGEVLYLKASELQAKQVKEYGEQFVATDALNLARALANKDYMINLKIARVALKGERGASESLKLTGSRKESLSGWMEQAKAFYANAISTPNIIMALSRFGVTREKLESGQALIAEVEVKLNAQLKEKGEAQAATKTRDEAFDALQDWMSDFVAIARIALEGQSQHLEVLGLVEPS